MEALPCCLPQGGSPEFGVRGTLCIPWRASDRPVSGAWLHLLPSPAAVWVGCLVPEPLLAAEGRAEGRAGVAALEQALQAARCCCCCSAVRVGEHSGPLAGAGRVPSWPGTKGCFGARFRAAPRSTFLLGKLTVSQVGTDFLCGAAEEGRRGSCGSLVPGVCSGRASCCQTKPERR